MTGGKLMLKFLLFVQNFYYIYILINLMKMKEKIVNFKNKKMKILNTKNNHLK